MLNDIKNIFLVFFKLCGFLGVVGFFDGINLKFLLVFNGERNFYNRKEDLFN